MTAVKKKKKRKNRNKSVCLSDDDRKQLHLMVRGKYNSHYRSGRDFIRQDYVEIAPI